MTNLKENPQFEEPYQQARIRYSERIHSAIALRNMTQGDVPPYPQETYIPVIEMNTSPSNGITIPTGIRNIVDGVFPALNDATTAEVLKVRITSNQVRLLVNNGLAVPDNESVLMVPGIKGFAYNQIILSILRGETRSKGIVNPSLKPDTYEWTIAPLHTGIVDELTDFVGRVILHPDATIEFSTKFTRS